MDQNNIIHNSAVQEKILEILKTAGVDFTRLDHEPVFTSEDATKIRDTDISMGAKALVCFADKNPVLVVVPADKKMDFKKFKLNTLTKDLRLASREEVLSLTGLTVGSIPPVGQAMELKSYFDKSFEHKSQVAFNVGAHTCSIKMAAADLIKIEKPILIDVT